MSQTTHGIEVVLAPECPEAYREAWLRLGRWIADTAALLLTRYEGEPPVVRIVPAPHSGRVAVVLIEARGPACSHLIGRQGGTASAFRDLGNRIGQRLGVALILEVSDIDHPERNRLAPAPR